MVFRAIVDVPGINFFLNSADAVKQSRRTRLHPRTREFVIAAIWFEPAFGDMIKEGHWERRVSIHIGDRPRFRRVGDISVG